MLRWILKMALTTRNQNFVTITVLILFSTTISLLLSVTISMKNVSYTSVTKCFCSDPNWRSSLIEQLREEEGGHVTVQDERPQWLHLEHTDFSYPDFYTSLAAVQPRRKQHLREVCHKTLPKYRHERYRLSEQTLKHLYVNEKLKLVYCSVPKAGCTNWKRVLLAIDNSSLHVANISRDTAHHSALKTLHDYPEYRRSGILKHYTKFLFTRDPFVRLLSAYKDKFEGIKNLGCERHSEYFKTMAGDILERFRAEATPQMIHAGEGVTWTEFVRFVIDSSERADVTLNEHWQTTYDLCAPCTIKYDYIGKIENIHEDSTRLLRRLFHSYISDKRIYYLKSSNPTVKYSAEFDKAFGAITIDELRQLWNIYEIDFQLFNYTEPNFLSASSNNAR